MCEIAPNPGRIRIYTSGWPKNQKRCLKRIGSPPPVGSKKDVFKFRSVRSIVIAPARTGRARRSIITVINTAHKNSGSRSIWNPLPRIFMMVVIKFSAPRIDLAPARWREKIARSTDGPAWAIGPARGG